MFCPSASFAQLGDVLEQGAGKAGRRALPRNLGTEVVLDELKA